MVSWGAIKGGPVSLSLAALKSSNAMINDGGKMVDWLQDPKKNSKSSDLKLHMARVATVHIPVCASHKTGCWAGNKGNHSRNLLGRGQPLQRVSLND